MRRAAPIAFLAAALAVSPAVRAQSPGVPADAADAADAPDVPDAADAPGVPDAAHAPARSAWLRFEEPGRFEALLAWYPPLIVRNGVALKDFIRSGAYAEYRRRAGDGRALDAIYVRAMSLTCNNTAAALLLASVATFDHYRVGLRVPVFNLFFPLSNESHEEFSARVENLPARVYDDSPPGEAGDRDKLQHFFGSAFVAFVFESRGAARRVGEFVEAGEDLAIVDGVLDDRDRRANWNGTEFGLALLAGNLRYPSEFLRTMVVGGEDGPGAPAIGGRTTDGPGAAARPGRGATELALRSPEVPLEDCR